jgi:predicted nucleic acid-binding protein
MKIEVLSFSELVRINNHLHVVDNDPDDDKVLETAVVCKADFIVSGDQHLIGSITFQDIPVIQAVELLSKVRTE